MTSNLFIDTNLLVYAYDISEPQKQKQAIDLLDAIVADNLGVVSTQVLVEFAHVVTRKIPFPLSAADAYSQLEQLLQVWKVLDISPRIVLEAVRGVRDYGFSIWDAQIWAAARLNGISVVLSEDFNSGATIEGIQFINPFSTDFSIDTVLA